MLKNKNIYTSSVFDDMHVSKRQGTQTRNFDKTYSASVFRFRKKTISLTKHFFLFPKIWIHFIDAQEQHMTGIHIEIQIYTNNLYRKFNMRIGHGIIFTRMKQPVVTRGKILPPRKISVCNFL